MASSISSINRPWTFGGRPKTRQVRIKHVQPGQDQKFQPSQEKKTAHLEKLNNTAREKTFLSLNLLRSKNNHVTFPRNVEIESSATSSSNDLYKMDTDRSHCLRMTPAILCEYFRLNGFGQPRVVTSSYGKRQSDAIIIPHPRPFYNLFDKNYGRKHGKRVKLNNGCIKNLPNENNYNKNFHLYSKRPSKKTSIVRKCTSAALNEKMKAQGESVLNKRLNDVNPSDYDTGNQQRIEAWLYDVAKAKTDPIEYF